MPVEYYRGRPIFKYTKEDLIEAIVLHHGYYFWNKEELIKELKNLDPNGFLNYLNVIESDES